MRRCRRRQYGDLSGSGSLVRNVTRVVSRSRGRGNVPMVARNTRQRRHESKPVQSGDCRTNPYYGTSKCIRSRPFRPCVCRRHPYRTPATVLAIYQQLQQFEQLPPEMDNSNETALAMSSAADDSMFGSGIRKMKESEEFRLDFRHLPAPLKVSFCPLARDREPLLAEIFGLQVEQSVGTAGDGNILPRRQAHLRRVGDRHQSPLFDHCGRRQVGQFVHVAGRRQAEQPFPRQSPRQRNLRSGRTARKGGCFSECQLRRQLEDVQRSHWSLHSNFPTSARILDRVRRRIAFGQFRLCPICRRRIPRLRHRHHQPLALRTDPPAHLRRPVRVDQGHAPVQGKVDPLDWEIHGQLERRRPLAAMVTGRGARGSDEPEFRHRSEADISHQSHIRTLPIQPFCREREKNASGCQFADQRNSHLVPVRLDGRWEI
ncbi:conserved hypothetical protein [Trichinella spiralis]|uniref:hypothetical protein n=1 Tax=Trichinella spiralis TaxID=6334 RepID=UPI0001EFE33C|nr:conserved hypothetical protein [Trichinella spiralis]